MSRHNLTLQFFSATSPFTAQSQPLTSLIVCLAIRRHGINASLCSATPILFAPRLRFFSLGVSASPGSTSPPLVPRCLHFSSRSVLIVSPPLHSSACASCPQCFRVQNPLSIPARQTIKQVCKRAYQD
ncbi:PREDICTED: uncharacterized protein LOC109169529 [Ipomoea nil]|uniref:uncharacterized protein LOC109169529 n=1 Tax=Ipomoea nil TaxID=35883 RepID=UPI000901F6AD|nr:PREDICTED: uncharacterized protein LOC109169529 [Ipomoea nil]